MSFPTGVITRRVSAGPAFILEDGQQAETKVIVRASRSLVHNGRPLVASQRTLRYPPGEEVVFDLPVCDMTGDIRDSHGRLIEIKPGEVTHTYQIEIRFFKEGVVSPVETWTRDRVAIFSSQTGVVDLDTLVSTTPPTEADGIWVGDLFTEQLAAAQLAATVAASEARAAGNAAAAAQSGAILAANAATNAQTDAQQAAAAAAAAAAHAENAINIANQALDHTRPAYGMRHMASGTTFTLSHGQWSQALPMQTFLHQHETSGAQLGTPSIVRGIRVNRSGIYQVSGWVQFSPNQFGLQNPDFERAIQIRTDTWPNPPAHLPYTARARGEQLTMQIDSLFMLGTGETVTLHAYDEAQANVNTSITGASLSVIQVG